MPLFFLQFFLFIKKVLYLAVLLILKTDIMTNEKMAELLQENIKNLEWAEDYHQRKLQETEYQLSLFRKELKSLEI
jgi:hypothetical protein